MPSPQCFGRNGITRRGAIRIAAGAALALPALHGVRRAHAADAKILKVIPEVDLKILDPVWTTATVTSTHGLMVYDTLFAMDRKQQVHPQMVEKFGRDDDGMTWHFTLRDGLGWHDGTPVTARDCVASIRRWAARFGLATTMMQRTERLDPVDDKSFILKLKEPFAPVTETLGSQSQMGFMMRAKDAETDPYTQLKEAIGSGPFRFLADEWRPGASVAYARNPDYKPRSEPADGFSGGKVVHVDRVEWTVIPESSTAAAAITTGEMDFWTNPAPDNLPQLSTTPDVALQLLDPLGWQLHVRFNSLAKPLDNVKMRQGLQMMVESQQEAYLTATGFTGEFGQVCLAPFVCGSPNESMVGTERFQKYDPERIKALFKEGGYNGETLVLMDPTDQPHLHMLAQVLNEHMKTLGLNPDMQSMDWSTLVSRRAVKDPPPAPGGWHIFPTAWPAATMSNPVVNAPLDTSCDGKNWFGWPCDEELLKRRLAYLAAATPEERHKAIEAIQLRFFESAPYAYAGQYFPPVAFRKDRVRNPVGLGNPVFWNLEKFA
ncbi:MAG: ABC transporter substrate-binding protein [Alphaproteobacteria bacterium]|nr:ABC transporter substrate-binding protein [Alphaproteobacteria bacterium]